MKLTEIVAVSGIGGLHKIIGRTKTGLILESINETKKRFATGIQDKVSILDDVSMYTLSGDMRLAEVFVKLNNTGKVPGIKEDPKLLRKFLVDTIELDSERVYDSDIKKLLSWYHIIKDLVDFNTLIEAPETKEEASESAETTKKKSSKKKEETVDTEEEKPKKTAKKTAAKTVTESKTTKATTTKTVKVSSKTTAKTNTYRPKSV